MLCTLHIENFTIVHQLELDFSSGMTAFTGETGAGKSILIDALSLLLGGRADSHCIRPPADKCTLSATFHIDSQSEPWQWLEEHDLPAEEELIIRRVINLEGRSKCSIQGSPFPAQKLKELGELLVHIHGQHEHQALMHHATHRQQLDRYAHHDNLLTTVQQHYQSCQKIRNNIQQLQSSQESFHDRMHLLQYQIDELSAAEISIDEIPQLQQEHQRLHHSHDYLAHAQTIQDLLHNDNEPRTICAQLHSITQHISHLPPQDPRVCNLQELIHNALIQCEEAAHEIQHFADSIAIDPERLQTIESRLSQLHQMARKYQVDMQMLPEKFSTLQKELAELQGAEEHIATLEKDYQVHYQAYHTAAIALRAARSSAAKKLSDTITQIIQELGMPKGEFVVTLTPVDAMQPHGLDKVEYKVCTNPGMPLDALQKIASGGELSRISLAIQMVTAQQSATPSLLFDEVDVGIGGATAARVGKLLRQVGERLQVFCVTHQPQVAACAHHHFLVEKYSETGQTYSRVSALSLETQVQEIARMLGGLTITQQTLSHAKELLLSPL